MIVKSDPRMILCDFRFRFRFRFSVEPKVIDKIRGRVIGNGFGQPAESEAILMRNR